MTTMVNYGLMVALFMAWVGLFAVKDASREAGMQVHALEQQIQDEEAAIQNLATDWAILNEPSYLQGLARNHLALNSMAPQQIVSMAALPPVPLHDMAPTNSGTFLASAPVGRTPSNRRVGAFMQTRVAPPAQLSDAVPHANVFPHASQVRPTLRPANEG